MKTIKKAVLVLGMSAIAAVSAPAFAADAPAATGSTFGIVDMGKVMQTSDAAKDIFSQLDAKRKEYLAQVSKQEESLRSFQQEVEKEKGKLTKEQLDAKSKAFEEKVQQWQKLAASRKEILDHAYESSMTQLREKAAAIVAAQAKEKHYSAVFTQNDVMMSTPDLDMTEAVLAELNKTVKTIPVDWAAATSASPDAPAAGKKK